jgi:hypothetical protein
MRKIPLAIGDIMTPTECAQYLKIVEDPSPESLEKALKKLEKWRHNRKGPPFTKIEGQVRYIKPLVDDYLLEQTQKAS